MSIEVSKVNIVGTAGHPLIGLYSHNIISSTINQLAKHLVTKFKIDSKQLIDELERFEITLPKLTLPTTTTTPVQENITLSVTEPAKRRGRPPKDPSKVSIPKEKEEVDAPDISGVSSKEELDKYSANQLRAVLQKNNLRITGSKLDLVNRVWGILHSDEMPEDAQPKKRGRPSKKGGSISSGSTSSSKQFNKVEDSEPDISEPETNEEQTELDPSDLEDVWIKNNTVTTHGNGEKYLYHSKWHWVLATDKDDPTQISGFIGYLEGKKINTTRPAPSIFN